MLMNPQRIAVLGDDELAIAVRNGIQCWGHTLVPITSDNVEVDVLWDAIDTPVTSSGKAELECLRLTITNTLNALNSGTLVIISSQVPAGFSRTLVNQFPELSIVSIPEYFRRGMVMDGFQDPPFIAVGLSKQEDMNRVIDIYPSHLHDRISWMSLESAEMSKMAMNTFLGMSIAFSNEFASMCERTGATYSDVEKVLRSDHRIGKTAYVRAGEADGSHFLRDIRYLMACVPSPTSPLLSVILNLWEYSQTR